MWENKQAIATMMSVFFILLILVKDKKGKIGLGA
jgi:hypothetical protein